MSDREARQDVTDDLPEESAAKPDPAAAAKASVNKGGIAILALIALSLVWYLLSDRFTPYTDQARVQGYIVGVAPQVAGTVVEVWVKNNEAVEEGQRLFQIDPSQYQIAVDVANSNLESAVRQVEAGNAAVESARASLRAAQANKVKSEQDTARLEKLYSEDPGTISMRRLEGSRASLDQALARVTAAEADIQRAIEQKGGTDDEDNAILKAAQSAVEKAELDLSNTIVTASTRGLITDLRADVGQFAGTGSPVVTLISLHDVWIRAEFTENNLGHLHTGNDVEILFDSLPGHVFKGRVRSVGFGVSSGSTPSAGTLPTINNDRDWLRQSQRFPVIIEFDVMQSDELFRQLRIGGQTSVIAYSDGHGILKLLGKIYVRLMSVFSYAY
jgi:multidrug resistance efflux pump